MKVKIIIAFLVIAGVSAYLFYNNQKEGGEWVACTMDAKICPDGSAVGRSGPQCQFDACPTIKESTKAKIGEKIFNKGVYITPEEVISDSRCPKDVQCFWAGELKVRVLLRNSGIVNPVEKEAELTMGVPYNFDGKVITLLGSTPVPDSKVTIKLSDYIFEFQVK